MSQIGSYAERKAARKDYFEKYVRGWKLRTCYACNGSGRYDTWGGPKCSGCGGTGKERYKPDATPSPDGSKT